MASLLTAAYSRCPASHAVTILNQRRHILFTVKVFYHSATRQIHSLVRACDMSRCGDIYASFSYCGGSNWRLFHMQMPPLILPAISCENNNTRLALDDTSLRITWRAIGPWCPATATNDSLSFTELLIHASATRDRRLYWFKLFLYRLTHFSDDLFIVVYRAWLSRRLKKTSSFITYQAKQAAQLPFTYNTMPT